MKEIEEDLNGEVSESARDKSMAECHDYIEEEDFSRNEPKQTPRSNRSYQVSINDSRSEAYSAHTEVVRVPSGQKFYTNDESALDVDKDFESNSVILDDGASVHTTT